MTVLVVDDDRAIRDAVMRAIKFDGMECEAVATAREALQYINGERGKRPDLVILDLGLPDLDGLEVVRQVRAKGDDLPILVLTARTQISERVAGLDAGADLQVVEPTYRRFSPLKLRSFAGVTGANHKFGVLAPLIE